MPFDLVPFDNSSPPADRAIRGRVAYHDGLAAEEIAAREYLSEGAVLLAQRWRGGGAEIDLIFREGDTFVFVEVKKAKTMSLAAERLDYRQIGRIAKAAELYVTAEYPGLPPSMRMDAALVDGSGKCERIPNISL